MPKLNMHNNASLPNMNAHLRTTLKKGFFLKEENLIKLQDIVQKRVQNPDPTGILYFKVYRADGMLLQFDSAGEVVLEENSQRNAIIRIEMVAEAQLCKAKLIFDPKEAIDLAIEASDRDLAYLIFSDIKDYLNSEVLKFRSFTFDGALSSRFVFPFVMLIPLLSVGFLSTDGPSATAVGNILQSTDIQQKVNFLIQHRANQNPEGMKFLMLGIFGLMVGLFLAGSFLDKAFPRNIFCWGKAAITYGRIVAIREKILWGVVIAFVIAIASAFAVDYFKTPNPTGQERSSERTTLHLDAS